MSRQRLSNISSNYLTTHHTPILEHAYDNRSGMSDLRKRPASPLTGGSRRFAAERAYGIRSGVFRLRKRPAARSVRT
ncbi:hypothetical protein [Streptomyces similanensis]|uniref:Uncharacterized protein n=1 Tax=Streptomyces similanensis TaxID=1274988 RepID=A0ABP9LIF8_9ACTN